MSLPATHTLFIGVHIFLFLVDLSGVIWVSRGWVEWACIRAHLAEGVSVHAVADHTYAAGSNSGEWSFLSEDKVSRKQLRVKTSELKD